MRTGKLLRNLTFLLLSSCIFIRMDDSIDLGNNFRYIQDYPQAIIYQVSEENIGTGPYAIPPVVQKYAFNELWVAAISKDMNNDKLHYWLVDKNDNFRNIEPIDSTEFYSRLKQQKLKLK